MGIDRFYQVSGSSIMQEEDSLPQSPKRGRSELVAFGASLPDVIGESRTHAVQQQVREKIYSNLIECRNGRLRN
jgi:hypothetical protein